MKRIQMTSTIALLVLAGSVFPAVAQDRGRDHGRNSGNERSFQRSERPQQYRDQRQFQRQENFPQRQNFQSAPRQQFSQTYRDRGYAAESRGFREQNFRAPDYRRGNSFTEYGSRGWHDDRRGWAARGGYRGYVIPQTRFYSYFGRDHFFRIGRPQFYGGYPRFQYGGFWFRVVDPFPAYWASNWYDTDDVYIDYSGDGYYLYDRRYPDEGIPVEIEQ